MQLLLREMPLFVETARRKSFSLAAEHLDMYASTLSRRIAALEKAMGVPLFLRNTRKVELSAAGAMLLERCERIMEETSEAWNAVVGNMVKPAGLVRVSMYDYAYTNLLRGELSRFVSTWPDIQLSVNFNDREVDLLTEPYDVDFRTGPLTDSDLKARKALTIEPRVYASPKLFETYPIPRSPEDLRSLPCICLARMGNTWPLYKGDQRYDAPLRPAFSFGSISLCYEFALAGHGVAMLRRQYVEEEVHAGKLVRVLPEWSGPIQELFMVTAPGQTPRRIQIFIEYMADFFKSFP